MVSTGITFLPPPVADLFSGLDSLHSILWAFGLMFLMFAVTGLAVGINVILAKRDKKRVISWYKAQGKTVNKIELTFFPLRFRFRRAFNFEVKYTDVENYRHQAIVAAPMWSPIEVIEDHTNENPTYTSPENMT